MTVLIAKFSNGVELKVFNDRSTPKYAFLLQWEICGQVEKRDGVSRSRDMLVSRINEHAAFVLKKFRKTAELLHYEIVELQVASDDDTKAFEAEIAAKNTRMRREPLRLVREDSIDQD